MKIIVPVKRVIDAYVTVRVKADKTGVVTENVKMSMNPFCEIAVEQAVRLKEAGTATEIIAVTIGNDSAQDVLRTALAMGADRALHINSGNDMPEPLAIAKLLKAVVEKEQGAMVIMGKQTIDGDNNQTAQMMAALLGWAQGSFISEMDIKQDKIEVTREIDGGLQKIELTMPAVVSVDLRLNEPRYASLPNIMKAKKKPLDASTPTDWGVDVTPRLKVVAVEEPPARNSGVIVANIGELIEKLKNEAKVIS